VVFLSYLQLRFVPWRQGQDHFFFLFETSCLMLAAVKGRNRNAYGHGLCLILVIPFCLTVTFFLSRYSRSMWHPTIYHEKLDSGIRRCSEYFCPTDAN